MSVFDVSAVDLINQVAGELKGKVKKPEWADNVKTSCSNERAPQDRDWIYTRMASILYRFYADGPTGVGSLRSYYGSKQRRGVQRPHHKKASGKIIRFCVQSLEKEGFLEKDKTGRKISSKGQGFLDKASKEIKKKKGTAKERPVVVNDAAAAKAPDSSAAAEAKPVHAASSALHHKESVEAKLHVHASALHHKESEAKPVPVNTRLLAGEERAVQQDSTVFNPLFLPTFAIAKAVAGEKRAASSSTVEPRGEDSARITPTQWGVNGLAAAKGLEAKA